MPPIKMYILKKMSKDPTPKGQAFSLLPAEPD